MYKNKKFLAIIPARAGSKRLPNKNILPLNNKPLIAWSIEAGLGSKYIDEVVVSTDSKKISKIALQYNATVPFLRPDELSSDKASQVDVTLHAIGYLENMNKSFDFIVLLQPTSPLRTSKDIDKAIKLLHKKNAKAIVSVTKATHSPLWCSKLGKNNSMKDFLPSDAINKQSQELDTYYNLNGAIYIVDVKRFLKEKKFLIKKKIFAYIMDNKSSVDIDDELDFLYAQTIINYMKENK